MYNFFFGKNHLNVIIFKYIAKKWPTSLAWPTCFRRLGSCALELVSYARPTITVI